MSESGESESSGRAELANLAVAVVALVVALVALLGTTAQVLQQYLATAVGYSNCGERVMGPWARYTKLVFHPWELRFEVVFRSPEISVEPYPIGLSEGDGEDMDSKDLPDLSPRELPQPAPRLRPDRGEPSSVTYTAHWLVLLRTVSDMEQQSRIVQNCFRLVIRDRPENYGQAERDEPSSGLRIRVRLWPKIQTLDLMPAGVKKPYATTTLSSIVHLAAMLGIHWKQFDRVNDRYVADGNGLIIAGSTVPHLGIMFTFVRHGAPDFGPMRVIPTPHITKLAFGLVPTILGSAVDLNARYLTDVPRDVATLRLGSDAEIASTLALLGCDDDTIKQQMKIEASGRPFPLFFQIMGMLACTMRMRGSPFCVLPNPLPYRWDVSVISPTDLLAQFAESLASLIARDCRSPLLRQAALEISPRASSLRECINHNITTPEAEAKFMARIHDALDWCDEELGITRDHTGATVISAESKDEIVRTVVIHCQTPLRWSSRGHVVDRHLVKIFDWMDSEWSGIHHPVKWLVLMFRMVCWLNLHKFHPGDVQIPKSDLLGTRQPVYIS